MGSSARTRKGQPFASGRVVTGVRQEALAVACLCPCFLKVGSLSECSCEEISSALRDLLTFELFSRALLVLLTF